MQLMSVFCFLASIVMLFLGIVMFLVGGIEGFVDQSDKAVKSSACGQAKGLFAYAAVLMAVAIMLN